MHRSAFLALYLADYLRQLQSLDLFPIHLIEKISCPQPAFLGGRTFDNPRQAGQAGVRINADISADAIIDTLSFVLQLFQFLS